LNIPSLRLGQQSTGLCQRCKVGATGLASTNRLHAGRGRVNEQDSRHGWLFTVNSDSHAQGRSKSLHARQLEDALERKLEEIRKPNLTTGEAAIS